MSEIISRIVIPSSKVAMTPTEHSERFSFGTVKQFRQTGRFISSAYLWTGVPGSGRVIETEHETEQAALSALQAVYSEYPNRYEDCVVFYGGYDLLD